MIKLVHRFQINPAWFLLLILLAVFQSVQAATQPARVALVIGNADYAEARLRNPVNDADLMTETLVSRGFEVTTVRNATRRQMIKAFNQFTSSLDEQSIGLFYFAGHGIELDGNNYLMPVDAVIESEADVEFEGINAGRLLSGLKRSNNGLNLVILDACRNNPYARSFRSSTRGLARMQPASGSLILYATEPGNVASDGAGDNGVFTRHLVDAIKQENYSIEKVFKVTARNVSKATGKKQTPYIEGVVLGEFYFSGKKPQPVKSDVVASNSQDILLEEKFWDEVKSGDSIAMYEAYLQQYPAGLYAPLARIRIEQVSDERETELARLEAEIAAKTEQDNQDQLENREKILELLSIADSLYDSGDYAYAKIQYQSILYLDPEPETRALALRGMNRSDSLLSSLGTSGSSQPAVAPSLKNFDLNGVYKSDTVSSTWILNSRTRLYIKLNHNGSSIEGEFVRGLNGALSGKISGNEINITWQGGKCPDGEGSLSISPDGSVLNGSLICYFSGKVEYDVVFRKQP